MKRKGALSAAEQSRLCLVAQGLAPGDAEEAEERLLRQWGHLMDHLAGRICSAIDRDDARQEALLGFLAAARSYDPSRNVLFSTYLYHCVVNCLIRFSRSTSPVRLPESLRRQLTRLDRTEHTLQGELGRRPTDEELAAEASVPLPSVIGRRFVPREFVSMERAALGNDGDMLSLADIIADERPGPEEMALAACAPSDRDGLADAISRLAPLDRDVILRAYGLPPYDEPQSLREIGAAWGYSQTHILRIRTVALRALRQILGGAEALVA
jgi:RNA polymerase sigma factor (sigma-70 family)